MSHSIIDDAPYGKFHRKMVFLSSGGPFLDGYILSNIGVVIAIIQFDLGLSASDLGLVGAAALIGLFLGGASFGWLTDRIGRKVLYTVDLAALLVGSLLCLFVQEGWQLILLRIFLGIAVGADYPIATAILSEWLPAKERGRGMGLLMLAWFVGAAAAYLVGYVLIQLLGDESWRWVLASAAVPAAIIMVARFGSPESPRWLIGRGRRDEARASIRTAFGYDATDEQLDQLAIQESGPQARFLDVFRKPYGKRMLFVNAFWTCQIIPLFALYLFGPTILGEFKVSDDSPLGALLISTIFMVGILPAMWFVDRIGRRKLIIWSFVGMVIPLTVLGVLPEASPWLVIAAFSLYALFSGGPSILEWIYPTELFPTQIRGTAVGIATSVTRIGSAIGTYLVPVGLVSLGLGPTMLIGAGITLVGLLASIAWAPETKGQALHEASGVIRLPERSDSILRG